MTAQHRTQCPKCGHRPLPANQALPAACPACGLVLAKFGAAPPRLLDAANIRGSGARLADQAEPQATAADALAEFAALLVHVPERVDAIEVWARTILLAGLAVWGAVLIGQDFRTGELMHSFLHRPLLIFHEAGHVIFGLLGHWLMVLGGSLGQLIMPLVMGIALLWKNRDPFGAAVALWLLGVSWLDIAPYVYDALDPQLMLLSGKTGEEGGHDWIYLLSTTGLMAKAHWLGAAAHKLGALLVLLALGWGAWLLRQQFKVLRDKA